MRVQYSLSRFLLVVQCLLFAASANALLQNSTPAKFADLQHRVLKRRDTADRFYMCYPSRFQNGTMTIDPALISAEISERTQQARGDLDHVQSTEQSKGDSAQVQMQKGVSLQPPIRCTYGFLTRKEVQDVFGHWVADHYAVADVNMENVRQRIHFNVQEAAMFYVEEDGQVSKLKAVERNIVRNVAEVRKLSDPKQFWIRQIENAGAMLGALTFPISDSLKNANGIFSGPFKLALKQEFPDNTLNEIKHIDDLGFVPEMQTEDHKVLKFHLFFNRESIIEDFKEKGGIRSVLWDSSKQKEIDARFSRLLWHNAQIGVSGEELEALRPSAFLSFDKKLQLVIARGEMLNLVKTLNFREKDGTSINVPFKPSTDGTDGTSDSIAKLLQTDTPYSVEFVLSDMSVLKTPLEVTLDKPEAPAPKPLRSVLKLGSGALLAGQDSTMMFQVLGPDLKKPVLIAHNLITNDDSPGGDLNALPSASNIFSATIAKEVKIDPGTYEWIILEDDGKKTETKSFFQVLAKPKKVAKKKPSATPIAEPDPKIGKKS